MALEGTPWDTGLDLSRLLKMGDYIETVAPKYRDFLDTTRMAVIDTNVLKHQIPGGMISNMVSQLKQMKAVHRLEEVYAELPRTRQDLGFPPLVTPTSQITGVQAVLNVIAGRYKMVSNETQDVVYGLYGKTPRADLRRDPQDRPPGGPQGQGADHLPARRSDRTGNGEGQGRDQGPREGHRRCAHLCLSIPRRVSPFSNGNMVSSPIPDKVKPRTIEEVRAEDEAIAKAKADLQKSRA